jgi:hypothetical protein
MTVTTSRRRRIDARPLGPEQPSSSRATWRAVLCWIAMLAGCGSSPVDPLIEAVMPTRAAVGEAVDLVGERFAGSQRSVSFGGHEAAVVFWQDRRVRALVPGGAWGSTLAVVSVDGRRSNAMSLYVLGAPSDGRP